MLWYRLHLLTPSHCLISIGKQRTIVTRFVFSRYGENSRFPNLLRVQKKEKRTSRPLGPAYAPLILIWFWQLLLRKLHQYCIRTKPNRVRKTINMAAASFLSMNHLYCCHITRQKPFYTGMFSLPAWNFLTETAMKYMPRDGNSFPSKMASASNRVFTLPLAVSIQQFQTHRRADALSSRVFLPRSL